MSIQTSTKPKEDNIRDSNYPQLATVPNTPKKSDVVEVEVSIPALLLILVCIGALIWGGAYLYKKSQTGGQNISELPNTLKEALVPVTITLDNILLKGESKDGYYFIEYSDFECPYCKSFNTGVDLKTGVISKSTYKQITESFVDKKIFKYGFVPYIGVDSHKPAATNEVLGYYCAVEQNKGFEYQELIYSKTFANGLGIDKKTTQKEELFKLVKELKLDDSKFAACYDKRDIVAADKIQQEVDKEVRTPWANKYGKQNFGTPFFVVCKQSATDEKKCEGNVFVGAWPYEDIKGVLDTFIGAQTPK